jgi:16S rRNA U516 pseudouridylate synthase RsuA-like enzyme
MNIDLGYLPKGNWRELTQEEYDGLLGMLEETKE